MTIVVSFRAQQWSALLKQAIAHGEAPGRATKDLHKAIRAVKGLEPPGELHLFSALKWLALHFAEADVPARRALGHYLVGLAAYCQDTLEPPEPEPVAAAGGQQPHWLRD